MKKLATICLVSLCLIAIVSCKQKTEPLAEWQYNRFEFIERHPSPDDNNKRIVTVLYITGKDLTLTGRIPETGTNYCETASQLLNIIGGYGWELVSFDGKEYIVKRRKSLENNFFVNTESVAAER